MREDPDQGQEDARVCHQNAGSAFTEPVDEISGTVDEVSPGGITLNEFPGRQFQFSSVSTSAADMSARILGENNNLTRSEVATRVVRPAGHKTPHARAVSPKLIPQSGLFLIPLQEEASSIGLSVLPDMKISMHVHWFQARSANLLVLVRNF